MKEPRDGTQKEARKHTSINMLKKSFKSSKCDFYVKKINSEITSIELDDLLFHSTAKNKIWKHLRQLQTTMTKNIPRKFKSLTFSENFFHMNVEEVSSASLDSIEKTQNAESHVNKLINLNRAVPKPTAKKVPNPSTKKVKSVKSLKSQILVSCSLCFKFSNKLNIFSKRNIQSHMRKHSREWSLCRKQDSVLYCLIREIRIVK